MMQLISYNSSSYIRFLHPFTLLVLTLSLMLGAGCSRKLESVTISPNPKDMPMGVTQQFTLQGNYSFGKHVALPAATWSSSTPDVAQVSETGLVTAQRMGTATISALYEGAAAQMQITVVNAELTAIKVVPDTQLVVQGQSLQMKAIGHYSDGSEREHVVLKPEGYNDYVFMPAAKWDSSDQKVASINPTGLITVRSPQGSSKITATIGDIVGTAEILAEPAKADAALAP